ncbi:MAG: hypothetical protein JO031_15080 [Ktedonobacteraceae bacterium]|nr:hypothetical protein [Ktedonobacteraceae bacterium]
MAKVILDISEGVQEFLGRKQIDLYEEIREEIPSCRLETMSDPEAPTGSKDLITVVVVTTALVSAFTPVIIRTFNQFKPDITEVKVEETETHHPDGSFTIHRIKIYQQQEYNKQARLQPSKKPDLSKLLEQGKEDSSKTGN